MRLVDEHKKNIPATHFIRPKEEARAMDFIHFPQQREDADARIYGAA